MPVNPSKSQPAIVQFDLAVTGAKASIVWKEVVGSIIEVVDPVPPGTVLYIEDINSIPLAIEEGDIIRPGYNFNKLGLLNGSAVAWPYIVTLVVDTPDQDSVTIDTRLLQRKVSRERGNIYTLQRSWQRCPPTLVTRPNNTTAYAAQQVVAGIFQLDNVGAVGRRVDLRLLVTEGRLYTDATATLSAFIFTRKPATIAEAAAFTLTAADLDGVSNAGQTWAPPLGISWNQGVAAQISLGGVLSHLISGGTPVRGDIIHLESVLLENGSIWVYLVAQGAYVPTALCPYKIYPWSKVVG